MIDTPTLRALIARDEFQQFMAWLAIQGGLYAVETNNDRRAFADGRRSLVLDAMAMIDAAQPGIASAAMPARAAIQLNQAALQIAAKEKNLGRRSSDDHDGDDAAE